MGYTFHQENQAWQDNGENSSEDAKAEVTNDSGEPVADATAQTGTVDTSGTSGETETAADVSPVFDAADAANAANPAPEGTVETPNLDPEATGENALTPDYSLVDPETGTVKTQEQAQDEANANAGAAGGDQTEDADEDKFDGRKDPGDFTVPQVKKYLDGATDEQIKKVQAKEAKGQNRKGIMEYSKGA